MKIKVILAHPKPGSFNHAIAETVVSTIKGLGLTPQFHDLYQEQFDPLIQQSELSRDADVETLLQKHCDELVAADGIVIIHPNWWGQPPAVLKGWIDRVLRPDVAYRFDEGDKGEGIPQGLLKAQKAVVLNTSDTEETREQEVFQDPLDTIWKNCIFGFCGVTDVVRKTYSIVVTSTLQQRQAWLDDVKKTIQLVFSSIEPGPSENESKVVGQS